MGRTATISIYNATNADFTAPVSSISHGKIQAGQGPKNPIGKGEIGIFKVGNRTGAKIGPKGMVTYETIQNNYKFQIVFTWDHPFSGAHSAYTCYSNPEGCICAALSPANIEGYDQAINWRVELSPDYEKHAEKHSK